MTKRINITIKSVKEDIMLLEKCVGYSIEIIKSEYSNKYCLYKSGNNIPFVFHKSLKYIDAYINGMLQMYLILNK